MALCKLDTSGRWAADGHPLYVPPQEGITIEHDNIVTPDSGHTEAGPMVITWVVTDVVKVCFTYKEITGIAVKYMHDLMQGKTFNFTYYDCGVKTMRAYCGRCSYDQADLSVYPDEGGLYRNFKIDIIDMCVR